MSITKEEAIRIVLKTSLEYEKILSGTKYLLLYQNNKTKEIECFEMRFPRYAFQHLTGLSLAEGSAIRSAANFYEACINRRLSPRDIIIKDDMYVERKLSILSQLINFVRYSKMAVVFEKGRPLLRCDKVVGTTNFCIALNLHRNYYVPVSCLNEDVRNFGSTIFRVLAVFSAGLNDEKYIKIQNIAKGITLSYDLIPKDYASIIDLSEYRPSNKEEKKD